jgi:hypothetical protein
MIMVTVIAEMLHFFHNFFIGLFRRPTWRTGTKL